ncbi:peptide deformylase 1B, chloroplastic/mitochondrial [Beta vulgaris subsp. vulgaris]|uniref:peptide deformylase 1B, chloroplastic/mitochondrial n=1 Tax=Beta vulgaris subsp. vulgaris TaxID=3555 RepID=UPI0020367CC2|nr:peptide deformylase 1B, chloroplastic/mitochondrial [Beta vulgaris subsp. vulgaris]XP_048499159.1 peptide deformylase 1B, chloroplastic/mitochondrial [Beta vulgaris subsp. vulgaris]
MLHQTKKNKHQSIRKQRRMLSSSRLHHPLQWTQFYSLSSRFALLSFPNSSFSPLLRPSNNPSLKLHSITNPKVHAMGKTTLSPKETDFASSADLQFESPLKIVEYPDPRLRAKNKPIDKFDDNLKKLVSEMFDVMYKTDGIGLSAPQVGINVQLMVFNPVGERGEGEEIVLINPSVSKYSLKTRDFEEGCLSFPGLYANVQRPESVKIDAKDISGSRFSVTLSSLPARVFQHEFDHLQGVLFFERMTEEVLDTIREGLKALEMNYEKNTGLPSPEKIEARPKKIETRIRRNAGVGFGKS